MRRNKYIIILIFACWGLPLSGILAQAPSVQKEVKGVKVIANVKDDGIHLRWAPTSAVLWSLGNTKGYKIYRYTIKVDGEITDDKEFTDLTPNKITYRPEADWEAIINEPYAPVAAQALFGETFTISRQGSPNMMEAINKSREEESRFSFSLLAADLSPITAEYSGLYFVDKEVQKNKTYLYKVFIPESTKPLDTGMVYLSANEMVKLPRIKSLKAEFGDRSAKLEWNTTYGFEYYTAYNVERSTDSIHFEQINERPLVNAGFDRNKPVNLLYAADSLPENKTTYYYRVKGISPFGEEGPGSNMVKGEGKVKLQVKPFNIAHTYNEEGNILLSWEFDEGFEYMIEGFHIVRVENLDKGKVVKLNDAPIRADKRSFLDNQPLTSNYYQIIAASKHGDMQASVTHMAQTEDSIPPAPTRIIKVEVDTSGVAKINWHRNTEPDFYGYKVMKAYDRTAEFSLINGQILKDSVYVDTLNLNRITRKVFYKIISLDKHYNHSKSSHIFEATFPDVVAPVSPVLNKVLQDSLGVALYWQNSSSKDIRANLIYRKEGGRKNWKLVHAMSGKDSIWHDRDLTNNITYHYTLIAVDSAGNESAPQRALPITYKDFQLKEGIKFFSLEANRKEKFISVEWELSKNKEIHSIELYRGDETTPLRHFMKITPDEGIYIDKKLVVNTSYKYALRVKYEDGTLSKISQIKEIKY
ncbi:hypothetical protein JKA74_06925 [Marivirga sp. S37H4]|uniref:Fibronectin type-III domain-containing protein n=1 Tax=Marivirga aurantiaca TaxID=2802615 RepID=A0A935CAE8_9BACT|nr:hypothetical protein [Marivirga aurantiaca]MBK6264763.1 hypothetical protein [Marivirga aurantiaca]